MGKPLPFTETLAKRNSILLTNSPPTHNPRDGGTFGLRSGRFMSGLKTHATPKTWLVPALILGIHV